MDKVDSFGFKTAYLEGIDRCGVNWFRPGDHVNQTRQIHFRLPIQTIQTINTGEVVSFG